MNLKEEHAARSARQNADVARRTRANAATEARGILARLHQFARADSDVRSLLTIAELKQLGAAEETLRALAERLES